ncbi:MAG: hypothetical protein II989_00815 [Bacteroidales bacterium]|nr:hypothetical protein [Bacteroidales bacterium]
MGNRFVKIFHFAVMALALVAIVVFMVLHVKAGLETQMSKVYAALYVLLAIWAGIRTYSLGKDVFGK